MEHESRQSDSTKVERIEAILAYWMDLYRDETSMLLLQVPTIARQIVDCELPKQKPDGPPVKKDRPED